MALNPYKMREIVFHLLYSSDFIQDKSGCGPEYGQEESFPILMQHHQVTKKCMYMAESQAKEVQGQLQTIDQMISETGLIRTLQH